MKLEVIDTMEKGENFKRRTLLRNLPKLLWPLDWLYYVKQGMTFGDKISRLEVVMIDKCQGGCSLDTKL